MPGISVYTVIFNGIQMDYLVPECVLSCVPFASQIVVVDGGSTDGTIEIYKYLAEKYPQLEIYNRPWDEGSPHAFANQKEFARSKCRYSWCIRLDHDEVFHEKDANDLQKLSEENFKTAYRFPRINFYKDYQHYKPAGADKKGYMYMYRNFLGVEHKFSQGNLDGLKYPNGAEFDEGYKDRVEIPVFHYGYVRSLEKIRLLEARKSEHFKEVYKDRQDIKEGRREPFNWDMTGVVPWLGEHPLVMKERVTRGINRDSTVKK